MSTRIEVLAVTDAGIFRAGGVSQSEGGIFYTPMVGGHDIHLSHHTDGRSHWKSSKQGIEYAEQQRTPSRDITFQYIVTQALVVSAVPFSYLEYDGESCDGVFAIDLRKVPHGATPNLMLFLVSPDHLGAAATVLATLPQVGLYTKRSPWLILGFTYIGGSGEKASAKGTDAGSRLM